MKYAYNKKLGYFYPGLPATDLDDGDLTTEQQAMLASAVSQGLYSPAKASKAPAATPPTPAAPVVPDSAAGDQPAAASG